VPLRGTSATFSPCPLPRPAGGAACNRLAVGFLQDSKRSTQVSGLTMACDDSVMPDLVFGHEDGHKKVVSSYVLSELLRTEYGFSDDQVARILEAAERAAVE